MNPANYSPADTLAYLRDFLLRNPRLTKNTLHLVAVKRYFCYDKHVMTNIKERLKMK